MHTSIVHSRQFLRLVHGTLPFADYCRERHIAFDQVAGTGLGGVEYRLWVTALKNLAEPEQARIELELAQVDELSHPEAIARLLAAAEGRSLLPDSVPGDAALALWFFLHHRDLFQEVFLQQEIEDVGAWRTAFVPRGVPPDDLPGAQARLTESLREFFRAREGTGRFCAVDVYRLAETVCFTTHISDRLQILEVFTDLGEHTTQAMRPAFPVLFAYYPGEGKLLLKARQRSRGRVLELFQRFGSAVLGIEVREEALAPAFRLDLFKRRFNPLPDGVDMLMVRVKALHLAYSGRESRRIVKLETLSEDGQFAILDLLHQHGGGPGTRDRLDVVYAEVQVTLRVAGGRKNTVIRLWPDRCSLNHSPLGERLRHCLRRWGIAYGD